MKIRINKNTLACAFWTVSMMAYMFQCYQRELATLIVPCLATFLLLESNHMKFQSYRSWMPLYCFFFFLSDNFRDNFVYKWLVYWKYATVLFDSFGNSIGTMCKRT